MHDTCATGRRALGIRLRSSLFQGFDEPRELGLVREGDLQPAPGDPAREAGDPVGGGLRPRDERWIEPDGLTARLLLRAGPPRCALRRAHGQTLLDNRAGQLPPALVIRHGEDRTGMSLRPRAARAAARCSTPPASTSRPSPPPRRATDRIRRAASRTRGPPPPATDLRAQRSRRARARECRGRPRRGSPPELSSSPRRAPPATGARRRSAPIRPRGASERARAGRRPGRAPIRPGRSERPSRTACAAGAGSDESRRRGDRTAHPGRLRPRELRGLCQGPCGYARSTSSIATFQYASAPRERRSYAIAGRPKLGASARRTERGTAVLKTRSPK